MKKQALFTAIILLGVSYLPLQASDTRKNRSETVTGKSSWTICKGVAKIAIGAPLALGGLKGLIAAMAIAGVASVDRKNDMAMHSAAIAVVSAGCLAGGGYLAYSGIQDLNDNEEKSDTEFTYA